MTSPASSQVQKNAPTPWRSSAIAHTATRFEDGFWATRLQAMREGALPAIYEQMRADGHFENFYERWNSGVQRIPYVFWESDISKWIEAASYSQATHPDPAVASLVDEAIAFLIAHQQPVQRSSTVIVRYSFSINTLVYINSTEMRGILYFYEETI